MLARSTFASHRLTSARPQVCRPLSAMTLPDSPVKAHTLERLQWDNTFVKELPGDSSEVNQPRQVFDSTYSFVTPTPTNTEPTTILASNDVAQLIGLEPSETQRAEFALIFSGNAAMPGTKPYAQCYGGHQFGSWAGQLGDGRAICLGETVNPTTGEHWELQLKGAGKTPYSRFADGRAVLRSSIREFLASEFMGAAGVPTTRALSLVATGDQVMRDMFYNGNQRFEPGAVVCRVARSFIRFGTFQLPATRGGEDKFLVQKVANYVLKHHFAEINDDNNKYATLLEQVAKRTAFLVSEWHRVGFVHGVLNTDNMSILGDTIDYGPFGFMERFDPNFTPNTTDLPGRRYAFGEQPSVGQWNLLQLAQSFIAGGLITQEEAAVALRAYGKELTEKYETAMKNKLGMDVYDEDVINELFQLMYEDSSDYTNTFRALMAVEPMDNGDELPPELANLILPESEENWKVWLGKYKAALRSQGMSEAEKIARQRNANPAIVPRNHVMVEIIQAAEEGNYEPLKEYYHALLDPYENKGLKEEWVLPAPKKCRLGIELLSCSS